jgi:hypothetical protein
VKHGETPYVTLQRQPAARDGGAAVLPSEEDGGRKGVVREHQRHTARTADGLMPTRRPRVVLATRKLRRLRPSMAPPRHAVVGEQPDQNNASIG